MKIDKLESVMAMDARIKNKENDSISIGIGLKMNNKVRNRQSKFNTGSPTSNPNRSCSSSLHKMTRKITKEMQLSDNFINPNEEQKQDVNFSI